MNNFTFDPIQFIYNLKWMGIGMLGVFMIIGVIIGANVGTCVTALLAGVGGNANARRVALIHLTFNAIGAVIFTVITWIFSDQIVNMLTSLFPNDADVMSVQMRVSVFHVIFNVTNACIMLPFVKQLVDFSKLFIKDKKTSSDSRSLRYVDDRLIATPSIALGQVKMEMEYMLGLVESNLVMSFDSLCNRKLDNFEKITENEAIIDFTNSALTKFLIKLSPSLERSSEAIVGSYFHVLNDLERIGDHAENFYEIGEEMADKELIFSDAARQELSELCGKIQLMLEISKDAFANSNTSRLKELTVLEEETDEMKRALTASHFARLAEGNCTVDHSPYFSSAVVGLERVADHLVNVGYSIVSPIGSQKDAQ